MSRRKPLLIVARNFCPALSSCTMEVGPVVGQYVWSFAAWSFDIGLSWLSEQLWEAAARFVNGKTASIITAIQSLKIINEWIGPIDNVVQVVEAAGCGVKINRLIHFNGPNHPTAEAPIAAGYLLVFFPTPTQMMLLKPLLLRPKQRHLVLSDCGVPTDLEQRTYRFIHFMFHDATCVKQSAKAVFHLSLNPTI